MAEAAPCAATKDAAGKSSAAGGSCVSMALPLVLAAPNPEPCRAAACGAEHAEEQRRGEDSPVPTSLAPAQLQAEPRYQSSVLRHRAHLLIHMCHRQALDSADVPFAGAACPLMSPQLGPLASVSGSVAATLQAEVPALLCAWFASAPPPCLLRAAAPRAASCCTLPLLWAGGRAC